MHIKRLIQHISQSNQFKPLQNIIYDCNIGLITVTAACLAFWAVLLNGVF